MQQPDNFIQKMAAAHRSSFTAAAQVPEHHLQELQARLSELLETGATFDAAKKELNSYSDFLNINTKEI